MSLYELSFPGYLSRKFTLIMLQIDLGHSFSRPRPPPIFALCLETVEPLPRSHVAYHVRPGAVGGVHRRLEIVEVEIGHGEWSHGAKLPEDAEDALSTGHARPEAGGVENGFSFKIRDGVFA